MGLHYFQYHHQQEKAKPTIRILAKRDDHIKMLNESAIQKNLKSKRRKRKKFIAKQSNLAE